MFPLKRRDLLDVEQDLLLKLLRDVPPAKYMVYCLKPLHCNDRRVAKIVTMKTFAGSSARNTLPRNVWPSVWAGISTGVAKKRYQMLGSSDGDGYWIGEAPILDGPRTLGHAFA